MARSEPSQPRLLHIFSTFAVGGPQVRFAALANRFGRRYRHLVVAMDGDHACAERLDPSLDVEIVRVPVRKGRAVSLANLAVFRSALRRLRPDLLLTYNFGAIEWALANRLRPICRHVHFEDGFGPEEARGAQLRRRVALRRVALGPMSEIVVPSRVLETIATSQWGFVPEQVRRIANGVDCRRFEGGGDPALLQGSPEGALLVGSVGALRPEKNFARLLRAFAALPNELPARLLVAGDGPERARLEALAAELGIAERTRFLGRLERPEALLGLLDLFVLSSDTEQMPVSLAEAMAAALAVAATDVGDVRSMVSEENRRFIVPAVDERALSAAIGSLLRDPERRAAIGAANRARARSELDEAAMARAYEAIFAGRKALIAQPRSQTPPALRIGF